MKNLAKHLQRLLGKKTQLRNSAVRSSCGINSMESNVPRGCLPVYVGSEGHRFIVDIHFLSHPLFEDLLDLSAQELGYSHNGGLRVACNIPLFEHILRLLDTRNPSAHYMQITDLLNQLSG